MTHFNQTEGKSMKTIASILVAVAATFFFAQPAAALDVAIRGGDGAFAVGANAERELPILGRNQLGVEFTSVDDVDALNLTFGQRWRTPMERVAITTQVGAGLGVGPKDNSGFVYNYGIGAEYAINNSMAVGIDQRQYRTTFRVNGSDQNEDVTSAVFRVRF